MNSLTPTRHALSRMSQRGMRPSDLDYIIALATEVEGGFVILERDYQNFERQVKRTLKRVRRLVNKRIVSEGDSIITAYHMTENKKRRLFKASKKGNLL